MLHVTAAQMLDVWEASSRAATPRRSLALLEATSGLGGEELAALPVGRCDALLLELRERLFGTRLECETRCPRCGDRLEFALATAALRVAPSGQEHEVQQLELDGVSVTFRAATVADLDACADIIVPEQASQALLARCIQRIEPAGATLDATQAEAVAQRMATVDPQADLPVELACPQCAQSWTEPFDIGAFVAREMNGWAQRVLDDIHVLAASYGWSERDILALSPARRRHYVERVAG
jgi:hypothetical protein